MKHELRKVTQAEYTAVWKIQLCPPPGEGLHRYLDQSNSIHFGKQLIIMDTNIQAAGLDNIVNFLGELSCTKCVSRG